MVRRRAGLLLRRRLIACWIIRDPSLLRSLGMTIRRTLLG
jgi:hypothetical protein